jgi:hypothetical protein
MTHYVSRVLDLPPLTAAAAFDAVAADGVVRAGSAWLELTGPVSAERTHRLSPHRRAPARLRHPRQRRGAVTEVEVGVWSSAAVELGLRPVRRIRPLEPYFDAAHAALAVLAGAMSQWVDAETGAAVEAIFVHPALRPRPQPRRP